MENYLFNNQDNALKQFELLYTEAQKELYSTIEFKSALAIYEELYDVQQKLYMKEISLRKEAFNTLPY